MLESREISSHVVRASAALTASYVAGTVFSMDQDNFLGLEVSFTKGTETSLDIKIETSNDGGTTYMQQVASSTTGGEETLTLLNKKITATGVYSIEVYPIRAKLVKISVKGSGTPTGTCAIKAYHSWA